MKRMSDVITNKLILQAEEAKTVGLSKLGDTVYDAVASMQIEASNDSFNSEELQDLVRVALWKAACGIAAYHDLQSMDIQEIDRVVVEAGHNFIRNIERQLNIEDEVGKFESILPGEQKS